MDETTEALESVPMDEIENIISDHMILVVVIVIALLVLYVFAGRITHWMVRRTLEANAGEFEDGGVTAVELDKRAQTLESLVATLIRSGVILAIAFLFIGFFGLWSVLTGMAIMLAALTLAGPIHRARLHDGHPHHRRGHLLRG